MNFWLVLPEINEWIPSPLRGWFFFIHNRIGKFNRLHADERVALRVLLLPETLLTNDKIDLAGNYFLDCVNMSNSELHLESGMLLEKKRIIY